ncbi:dimethyl sulfoxide reductase, partial [Endozoicomonas sp. (ex Bugula neritina AB1)]
FIATLFLLGIGAIASITHLGQPLRMFNVLMGIEHASPLTLEIIALSLFGGTAALFTALRLFGIQQGLQRMLLIVGMLLGVVFVFAIANVYTLNTVVSWNSAWTPFQFFMTVALVGPLGAATLLRLLKALESNEQLQADQMLSVISGVGLIAAVMGYAGYLVWLGQLDVSVNPFEVAVYAFNLPVARVCLLLAGILSWLVFSRRSAGSSYRLPAICLVMVLTSELMGRAFFYDVYISAGAGM